MFEPTALILLVYRVPDIVRLSLQTLFTMNLLFSPCAMSSNSKNISFEKNSHIDFEIRSSIKELLDLILSKKIKKEIIYGDNEKAILMINAILKSDIDIIFLIDKYFGNTPAVLAYLAKEKLFTINQHNKRDELQSKLRNLSIRLDRLEAVNNL